MSIYYNSQVIKAVIFDLDDTMVNTCPLHIESWYILLKQYHKNYDEVSEEMRSRFMGMRIKEVAKEVKAYFQLDTDLESFYQKRIAIFIDLIEKKLEMLPGLRESLAFFNEQRLQLAIGSSGTRSYIDVVLDKLSLRSYFEVVVMV